MRQIIQRIKSLELAKVLSLSSLIFIVQALTGIVINKIIAIKLGPTGLPIIGNFMDFKNIIVNLASGGFGQGITKYIADKDFKDKKLIISTSIISSLFITILISTGLVLFVNNISTHLFKTSLYSWIIYAFAAGLPFLTLNALLISILNGFKEYKIYTIIQILNSIISLILTGTLCWFLLLKGALIAIAVNTSFVFFISILFLKRYKLIIKDISINYFDFNILKRLFGFTIMSIFSFQLVPMVQLYIRDFIIENSNQELAGIWEAMKRFSQYYTGIITSSLTVYYLPKLSSLKNNKLIKIEVYNGLKIITPLFIAISLIIYFLRVQIITLLFSNSFIQMDQLFIPQLIGDFLMLVYFLISYIVLAKAFIKIFIVTQVLFSLSRIFLSTNLFMSYSILGVVWANAFNYLFAIIVLSIILRKYLFN